MKKLLLALIAFCLLTSPAYAKPKAHHFSPHKPAPTIIHHSHKGHHIEPIATIAAGLIGFAIGNASATANYTNYSATTDDKECFLVVSKSSGNVTQRCVDGSNQVLYVD